MRRQFVESMTGLMRADENVVLLLGDIGVYGFEKAAKEFPGRVINIGILEQATIGLAAGLASRGLHPVVHTIAPFIVERALEQIKIDLAYQELNCSLVSVGASYDYAALGATHHCPADVGILLNVPGMDVNVPGTAEEFHEQLVRGVEARGLSYFRLSEHVNLESHSSGTQGIEIVRTGSAGSVLAIGTTLDATLVAAEKHDLQVLYTANVNRLAYDFTDILVGSRLVIVEPYYAQSSLQILNARILQMDVTCIGVPRAFIHSYGTRHEQDVHLGLDADGLSRSLSDLMQ